MSTPHVPPPAPRATAAPNTPAPEIRPRTLWYWVAASVLVLCLAAGTCILVFGTSPERPNPSPGFQAEFDGESSATFEVGEGESRDWALYSARSTDVVPCEHRSPSGESLELLADRYSYQSDDGEWEYVATLDTREPGTHRITCSASMVWGGGSATTPYAVGGVDVVRSADAQLGLGVVSGILIPMVGFFAGLIIFLVTLITRLSRKADLRRRQQHPWPHGPVPPYRG
ncbi:hypothetical protein [Nocardiopsis lucentensis]|uniref:hypothetical protein n=1 Tax=Nocardiopsis lucentensis TaxID=53441 RepID=UPI00034DDD36|nr:hypothetical protein [Nocardiopsis lucentensis]